MIDLWVFFLLVFKTRWAIEVSGSAVALGNRGSALDSFHVQTLCLSGSMEADGVIRIGTLVVKYLDRPKSNYCEGISQACLH